MFDRNRLIIKESSCNYESNYSPRINNYNNDEEVSEDCGIDESKTDNYSTNDKIVLQAGKYYDLGLRPNPFITDITEGYDKKHQHPPFVRGCVASVTKNKGYDVDRAFAVCQSQYKKHDKDKLDNRATSKKDWSKKEKQYEKALSQARKLRKKKK